MQYLRSHRAAYVIPDGGLPESPSTSPRHPKRWWEKRFHLFKRDCNVWRMFMEDEKATPRTTDANEAHMLKKQLEEHMTRLR